MIKAWSGARARSSLRSKHSVITLLWIHSGFYILDHGKTAPCSLHLNVITDNGLLRGKKHVASTQKSAPPRLQQLTENIVMPLASFTVGFLAENTEQNLNFGADCGY